MRWEKKTLQHVSVSPFTEYVLGNKTVNVAVSVAKEEDSAKTSIASHNEFENDAEHNLSCCIIMLDILLKQMELQNIDKHTGLNSSLCKDVCSLLKCMITSDWIGTHICNSKTECTHCESCVMWHQLSLLLVKYLSPIYPARPPDVSFILNRLFETIVRLNFDKMKALLSNIHQCLKKHYCSHPSNLASGTK